MHNTKRFVALVLTLLAANELAAQRLISVDSSRALYKVDPATGARTSIGSVSAAAGTTAGLTLDPTSGTVYLTSSSTDSLYTLDIDTGNATLVGAYGDSTLVMHGLEYHWINQALYGGSNGNIYQIDPNTGVATLIGSSGFGGFVNLVYVPTTNTMYATVNGTTTTTQDSWYSVDVNTGVFSFIGSYAPAATNINGLAYDLDTDTIYAVDNSTDLLYTVDRNTGGVTTIGSLGASNLLGLVWLPGTGTYNNFATGCAGSLGIPGNIVVRPANIGHNLVVRGTNLPLDAGAMIVGFSNTVWAGGSLPQDLGILGAPSCSAFVSPDMIEIIVGAPGSQFATYTTPVPDSVAFLNLAYFTQTYSLDGVNALGLVAGDAGAGIVGR